MASCSKLQSPTVRAGVAAEQVDSRVRDFGGVAAFTVHLLSAACGQPLSVSTGLAAVDGATRVRAPGVLMPLLGFLPLLFDHRHLAGAKHLRHSPEPLTLLHLLPWLTVHPVGRGPCLHDRAPYDDVRRALLPLDFAIGRKHSRGGSKRRILSTWFWRGPHFSRS